MAAWLLFVAGRHLYRVMRGDVPSELITVRPEWAAFDQRRYHPRVFTARKTLAVVTCIASLLAPVVALALLNGASIDGVTDNPLSLFWWKFPGWWFGLSAVLLIAGPVAAIFISGGKRCPQCGGATEEDRSPSEIVQTCEPCRIVYQTGWRVGGGDHHHDHHHHHHF